MTKTLTIEVYDKVNVDLSQNQLIVTSVDLYQIVEDIGTVDLLDAMEYEDIIKWVSAREVERKEDAGY